jgi:hypothetical protein
MFFFLFKRCFTDRSSIKAKKREERKQNKQRDDHQKHVALEQERSSSSSVSKLGTQRGRAIEVVEFDIDTKKANSKKTKISEHFLSINNEFASGMIDYLHPELVNLCSNELGIKSIRFPGGTIANTFDFERGLNDETDERAVKGNENIKRSKRNGKYEIEEFIEFIRNSEIKISLVLNLCTKDEYYTKRMCEKFFKSGCVVDFVELSNEVYFENYMKYIPTAEEYVRRCRKHVLAVKEVYPNAKIGVVISSCSWSDESFLENDSKKKKKMKNDAQNTNKDDDENEKQRGKERKLKWDKVIAENRDFYDAVVIHVYPQPARHGKQFYPSALQWYEHSLSHLEIQLAKTMKFIEDNFSKKKVWITEFGVGGFGGEYRQDKFRFSYLAALMNIEMIRRISEYENIEMSNFHSLSLIVDIQRQGHGKKSNEHHSIPLERKVGTHIFTDIFKDIFKGGQNTVRRSLKIANPVLSKKTILSGKFAPCEHDLIHATLYEDEQYAYVLIVNIFDHEFLVQQQDGVFPFEGGDDYNNNNRNPISIVTFRCCESSGIHGEKGNIETVIFKEGDGKITSFKSPPYSAMKITFLKN